MYSIDLNYRSFIYPWQNSSVFHRLQRLNKKNRINILYLYETPDSSTFRYRVYNMCQAMEQSQKVSGTYAFLDELPHFLKYLDYVQAIVLVRVRWSVELDLLFSKAESMGIPIYFDVDDLIYDITKIPLVMSSLSVFGDEASHNQWVAHVARIFLTAQKANKYITTNQYLAEKIATFFHKECVIIPNFINQEQMMVSDVLVNLKKDMLPEKESILIGYFSGTPSHNNDFECISVDLEKLMQEDSRIKLRLVGYLDIPQRLQKFFNDKRIARIPLQNYLDLQVKIAECDINLIPLLVNEFTHCKSELKYFEAAIVGTTSIASRTFIYQEIIQDGVNGYLAAAGEWYEKIKTLIDGPKADISQVANNYAKDNYFGESILAKIEQVF